MKRLTLDECMAAMMLIARTNGYHATVNLRVPAPPRARPVKKPKAVRR